MKRIRSLTNTPDKGRIAEGNDPLSTKMRRGVERERSQFESFTLSRVAPEGYSEEESASRVINSWERFILLHTTNRVSFNWALQDRIVQRK